MFRSGNWRQELRALLTLAGPLIVNNLAVYLLWLAWMPGIWIVVGFEERELRQRFGPAYDDYCRRVPRFVPRRDGPLA